MEDVFANPYWHALKTEHAPIAIGSASTLRYPADVIPFAGLADGGPQAVAALRELLAPEESIYVTGERIASVPGLTLVRELPGWQFHFPAESVQHLPPANDEVRVDELHAPDAPAMVALTDVAFPGFFRARTYTLGRYFGVRVGGELIAMAGERLALPGYREISAVCTHPAHTGKGYAALLIRHLLRVHAETGLRSFLHVTASNERAIALYGRLGFTRTRPILFHQLQRQ